MTEASRRLTSAQTLDKLSRFVPGFIFQYRRAADGAVSFPFATQGIWDIYHVTPEEARLDATPCFDRIHADDLPDVVESIRRSEEALSKWDHVFRVQHPERGTIWLQGQSMPEPAENGAMHWHGCVLDVTQQRRSEIDAARRGAHLQAILNTLGEGVAVIDADNRIEEINPALRRLFGYEEDEMIGMSVAHLFDPRIPIPDHERLRRRLADLRRQGEGDATRVVLHRRGQRKDGSKMPLRVSGCEFPFGDDKIVVTIQDLTEVHAAQQQLLHVRKMDAMGQLTGGVAHDFNNMLAALRLNLELLEGVGNGAAARRLIQQCMSTVERGRRLTAQLLSFARRSQLSIETIDLWMMVTDLEPLLAKLVGDAVDLQLTIESDWSVLADRAMLESAVVNLCINARDAMPNGGALQIRCVNLPAGRSLAGFETDQDYVALRVIDDGVGMAQEVRERAFEPFFTTKSTAKGSGLGLSMVHGFIKQVNGEVRLESQEGEGTAVTLFLPRSHEATANAVRDGRERAPIQGDGERILLVEDDPSLRRSVAATLAQLGYHVDEAANADEALVMLQERSAFDAILADYRMPGSMTGLDLITRAHDPLKAFVLMSAYAEGLDAGSLDSLRVRYLQKPFSALDLATTIAEALRHRGGG